MEEYEQLEQSIEAFKQTLMKNARLRTQWQTDYKIKLLHWLQVVGIEDMKLRAEVLETVSIVNFETISLKFNDWFSQYHPYEETPYWKENKTGPSLNFRFNYNGTLSVWMEYATIEKVIDTVEMYEFEKQLPLNDLTAKYVVSKINEFINKLLEWEATQLGNEYYLPVH